MAHLAFPFLLIFYAVIITKLFTKYKDNFGPVHVLELTVVMDLVGWAFVSSFLLGYFEKFFQGMSIFCVLINFLEYTLRVSLNLDLIAGQLERFLAIYLNIAYHDIVTRRRSIQAVITIKSYWPQSHHVTSTSRTHIPSVYKP